MQAEQIYTFIKLFEQFVLIPAGQFLRNWWWFFLPFLLKDFFLERWKWWRNELWLEKDYNPIILELIIPQESEKPIRAMETVFANIHQVLYKPPDPWEKWIEGELQLSMALEIVSIEGDIHFYIRMDSGFRDAVESAFYAQYPSLEIVEAEDYTRKIPLNIPNEGWDLWAADYRFFQDDAYPIRTYKDFETEREATEKEKVDPVATLLEALSKVGPNEQLWLQMVIKPVSPDMGSTWVEEALAKRNELAKRPNEEEKEHKPILWEAVEILATGPSEKEEKKESEGFLPPEMHMTPGERDVVGAIERKASKPGFKAFIRFIFLGKKGYFNKANLRLPFIFFSSYTTQDKNALYPLGDTMTKIHYSWFLPLNYIRDRRKYLRQRKILRNYIARVEPFFPREGGKIILNTEEMASLFHFPSWEVSPVPTVTRVEGRKKAPPKLPEEPSK